jgi:signal transduction histidine kinase
VRRRLVLAIAVVAAGAVVLFAVPLAVVLQRTYRDEELLRVQRDAIALTRQINLGPGGDPLDLPRTEDVLAVYDGSGHRVAGRGPGHADTLVRTTLRTSRPADRQTDGHLVVAVPVLVREHLAGAVRAVRSDAAVVHRARRAALALAGLAAIVVMLAVLAALVLGRRLARPLERLAGAARRLGEGDFSVRAPRAGVPEVDAVASALDGTAQRLDELVSRERAFSADASHQLRTPLAALRLELEAMELRGGEPPELPGALAQVDRLQTTVDTLLAVARDVPRREQTTELTSVTAALEARWRGPLAAAGRPLYVRVEGDEARPVARASPEVLGEVLDVLLANAHRHGAGEVVVTIRPTAGLFAIDVSDEGPGFPGDPEAAFQRRAGSGNGHGIGLALARSLVDAEGGRLIVTRAVPHPVLTVLLRT